MRMRTVAVVLAGGTSRRFGGGDKTRAALGTTTVTGTLLAGLAELPGGIPAVVAGPEAGGGPAAALATALATLAEPPAGPDVVVALAGDLPFAAGAVPRLLATLAGDAGADAALGADPDGRRQYLLAAYRAGPLRRALGPDAAGRSMRSVVAGLRVAEVPVTAAEALDVDTAEDLERARDLLRNRN
jgi:molybdopterin-guanine dinucleotide biosynthesis protein A